MAAKLLSGRSMHVMLLIATLFARPTPAMHIVPAELASISPDGFWLLWVQGDQWYLQQRGEAGALRVTELERYDARRAAFRVGDDGTFEAERMQPALVRLMSVVVHDTLRVVAAPMPENAFDALAVDTGLMVRDGRQLRLLPWLTDEPVLYRTAVQIVAVTLASVSPDGRWLLWLWRVPIPGNWQATRYDDWWFRQARGQPLALLFEHEHLGFGGRDYSIDDHGALQPAGPPKGYWKPPIEHAGVLDRVGLRIAATAPLPAKHSEWYASFDRAEWLAAFGGSAPTLIRVATDFGLVWWDGQRVHVLPWLREEPLPHAEMKVRWQGSGIRIWEVSACEIYDACLNRWYEQRMGEPTAKLVLELAADSVLQTIARWPDGTLLIKDRHLMAFGPEGTWPLPVPPRTGVGISAPLPKQSYFGTYENGFRELRITE